MIEYSVIEFVICVYKTTMSVYSTSQVFAFLWFSFKGSVWPARTCLVWQSSSANLTERWSESSNGIYCRVWRGARWCVRIFYTILFRKFRWWEKSEPYKNFVLLTNWHALRMSRYSHSKFFTSQLFFLILDWRIKSNVCVARWSQYSTGDPSTCSVIVNLKSGRCQVTGMYKMHRVYISCSTRNSLSGADVNTT